MSIRKLHISAIVLFIVSLIFYIVAGPLGTVFLILGVGFESIAWIIFLFGWLQKSKNQR